MLMIDDYKEPKQHPFGMLAGIPHACEKESFMAWFLLKCIDAKNIDAEIETKSNEDYMCGENIGLLEKVRNQTYKLTKKAKGLLFAYYSKD